MRENVVRKSVVRKIIARKNVVTESVVEKMLLEKFVVSEDGFREFALEKLVVRESVVKSKNEYNLFCGKWGTEYCLKFFFIKKNPYQLIKSQKVGLRAHFPLYQWFY